MRSLTSAAQGWSVGAQFFGSARDERAVLVPGLARIEHLHVAHAALDEAPRDDAARGVVARLGLIDAVQFFDVLGLAGNIERFLRGGLHLRGEFVAGDARLEIELAGMLGEVRFVDSS